MRNQENCFAEFYIPRCPSAATSLPNSEFSQVLSCTNFIFWKCTKLHQAIMALLILLHWSCDKKISLYSKHYPQIRYSKASLFAQLWTGLLSILVMVSNKTNHYFCKQRGWLMRLVNMLRGGRAWVWWRNIISCALQWSPHAFGLASLRSIPLVSGADTAPRKKNSRWKIKCVRKRQKTACGMFPGVQAMVWCWPL